MEGYIHQYEFRNALSLVLGLAKSGNKLLNDTQPWKLIETDKAEAGNVLYHCIHLIAYLRVFLQPFLPFTAEKISKMLNMKEGHVEAVLAGTSVLTQGHMINEPELLFERVSLEAIEKQISKLSQGKDEQPLSKVDDFNQLDMRVASVLEVNRIDDEYYLLTVETDSGYRKIVSKIGKSFTPDELLGRKVLVLMNLPPRVIKGHSSEGMLLMLEHAGRYRLLNLQNSEIKNGARLV